MSLMLDDHIEKALGKHASFAEITWTEVDGFQGLREISRLLNLHKSVIDTRTCGPPAEDRRQLNRNHSETNGDVEQESELRKERQESWRQAQIARKNVSMCRLPRP